MRQQVIEAAGLRSLRVAAPQRDCVVVMLHGYAMEPEDLAPFAHSLTTRADFHFPQGPVAAMPRGHAWWPVDEERRAQSRQSGARDLAGEHPVGRRQARARLCSYLDEVDRLSGGLPMILGGFSQGGMLACELLLHDRPRPGGLALLSSSRLAADEWAPRLGAAQGLPVFVSHGRNDPDLAFSAGEALRDCFVGAGANVTWIPFDGGHEIPLPVWRALRKFIAPIATPRT
jgi:phospholipase/carboxylesterase